MHYYGGYTQGESHTIADDTATIIAAPGAGKRLHIVRGVVSISVVAIKPTAYVYLCNDATPPTIYWETQAAVASQAISYLFDFGDEGLELGLNEAFRIGATGSPYANAAFVGYVR